MRLMGTAKDDMRKAIIQESLNNLDSPERSHSKRIGQASPNMFETEKVKLLHFMPLNLVYIIPFP
jgi:hypothetical protein